MSTPTVDEDVLEQNRKSGSFFSSLLSCDRPAHGSCCEGRRDPNEDGDAMVYSVWDDTTQENDVPTPAAPRHHRLPGPFGSGHSIQVTEQPHNISSFRKKGSELYHSFTSLLGSDGGGMLPFSSTGSKRLSQNATVPALPIFPQQDTSPATRSSLSPSESLAQQLSPPKRTGFAAVAAAVAGANGSAEGAFNPRVICNVSKALKVFSSGPAREDPTDRDVQRGVQVEQIYDYWDTKTKKVRQRKMQDDVLHIRRQPVEVPSIDPDDPESNMSEGSSDSSGGSSGSGEYDAQRRSRRYTGNLRRSYTASNTEVVTTWGALVGKVLHCKVLDFTELTEKKIRARHIQTGAALSKDTDASKNRMVRRLQDRAKQILKQAMTLGKKIGKESDRFDAEWKDPTLLTYLFSTEYLDTLMLLTNVAVKLLGSQPMLAVAKSPCKIFGDLHGQLRDLLMFFTAFGNPMEDPNLTLVFNGDFVDRGAHQLEVMGLLLSLKVVYPDRVWLVRGNHEDRQMNERYGFQDSCMDLLGADFGPKVFELMQNAFNRLPVACLVAGKILCVHGGLGDGSWRLNDLRTIPRPLTTEYITDPANSWIFNILWSDPIEDGKDADPMVFGVHESPRGGVAAQFAWNITKTFCARNGLSLIVRSHQSKRGSRGFDVMHENSLVRVFSARDYEGHGNDGAILQVTEEKIEVSGEEKTLLVVRPQVVRSTQKARDEDAKRQLEAALEMEPVKPQPKKSGGGRKKGRKGTLKADQGPGSQSSKESSSSAAS